jgi:hypothetical protein
MREVNSIGWILIADSPSVSNVITGLEYAGKFLLFPDFGSNQSQDVFSHVL